MNVLDQIVGANLLLERFGDWPSFHDAEVLRITLDRQGEDAPCVELLIHTWLLTSQVDERGRYVLERHTLVRFLFERLISTELSGFNNQNALFGLEMEPITVGEETAFQVTLDPSYGVSGVFVCARVVVADVMPCDSNGKHVDET